MNKCALMGRLTADPEIRYTTDQKAVASFTLAVDRRVAKGSTGQTADFISCKAWEKRAEFAERYLHKGTKIVLVGRIQTGSYTNKNNQKVYTTDVIAEELEFAESKEQKQETKKPEDDFVTVDNSFPEELPFN